MPTYEYVCRNCGNQLEVVQAFSDEALTICPNCSGELRKVFGNVGIVFKGSGFYKTDSRSKTTAVKPAGGDATSTETKTDSTSSTETTTPAPAAPAAPASTPASSTSTTGAGTSGATSSS
jgi:putative FmdB family regulatory protein